MESSKETHYQSPEGPILCISNCGFFGSAATMNMCSKCHKDMISKQHQAQLAALSIENIVTSASSSNEKTCAFVDATNTEAGSIDLMAASKQSCSELLSSKDTETKSKERPSRCTTCCKRVGLTGFKCKCGDLFCSTHRYADQHACTFDYRTAGQNAIDKANPLVKAEKLDKI